MHETLLEELGYPPFRPRAPWWGADLQTLRDTLRGVRLPDLKARTLHLPIGDDALLLAHLDQACGDPPRGLVLLTHGLGGSSEGEGPRRLAMALRQEGFAVLRLNLRGAGGGRSLAPGTYAAECNRDLLPVLRQARALAAELGPVGRPVPLAGAGISLGGTILLNATAAARRLGDQGLDALVCTSSPLDLPTCSSAFERPRNSLYQRWLVRRLRQQALQDRLGLQEHERLGLSGRHRPRSIRAFDALITAPRWGHGSVEEYYRAASPLNWLGGAVDLPPTLLLHAADDPWVPADPTIALARQLHRHGPAAGRSAEPTLPAALEVCISPAGGHNGFHGPGDSASACWSDRLTALWLRRRLDACSGPG